jgi:hypothetical protein
MINKYLNDLTLDMVVKRETPVKADDVEFDEKVLSGESA